MFTLILLVAAFLLFLFAGFMYFRAPAPPAPLYWQYGLVSIGLACWVLSELVTRGSGLVSGH